LSAFEDLNGNTIRDGNEPGLADVTFVITSGGNEVARYQTDASGKPYCLTQLPPGAYSVQITLPPGYIAPYEQTDVALALGQRIDLAVAARKGEKATPTAEPTATVPAAQPGLSRTNTLIIVLVLFAAVFLVLIGIAISIIRRRR
jgi:hypothetical protein